jgi:hypothetical protein
MKGLRKFILSAFLILVSLCLLLVVFSAISNLGLPQHSEVIDQLSSADRKSVV